MSNTKSAVPEFNPTVDDFFKDYQHIVVHALSTAHRAKLVNQLLEAHYPALANSILACLSEDREDGELKVGDGVREINWAGQFARDRVLLVWGINAEENTALVGPYREHALWDDISAFSKVF